MQTQITENLSNTSPNLLRHCHFADFQASLNKAQCRRALQYDEHHYSGKTNAEMKKTHWCSPTNVAEQVIIKGKVPKAHRLSFKCYYFEMYLSQNRFICTI